MMKFFNGLSALVLLALAGACGTRAYLEIPVKINNSFEPPFLMSWIASGVLAFLAVMLIVDLLLRGKK